MNISPRQAVSIRPARSEDAEWLSVIAVASKSHWGYSSTFMAACLDELSVSPRKIRDPKFRYFLAELDGKQMGFYALEILSSDAVELEAMFVDPDHIGSGVGFALICHARNEAAKLGAQVMIIQSDPHAEEFYLKAGALPAGRKESGSIPGRYLPMLTISLDSEIKRIQKCPNTG